jgi:hypothetical protein
MGRDISGRPANPQLISREARPAKPLGSAS